MMMVVLEVVVVVVVVASDSATSAVAMMEITHHIDAPNDRESRAGSSSWAPHHGYLSV